jgi:predicted nucleic acid-binding protein
MKLMNANIFVDTNVLVYLFSEDEPDKKLVAEKELSENNCYISSQVLQEFCNVTIRKMKMSTPVVLAAVNEICDHMEVNPTDSNTVRHALDIHDHFGYSFYDSAIIATALDCGCTLLFSEDMSDGQIIDKRLVIRNIFRY